MSLSEAIKNTRIKSLMSQEVFAKELRVSVGTINRWENGKVIPNITAMKSIRCFCERNSIDSSEIEREWIDYKNGDKEKICD